MYPLDPVQILDMEIFTALPDSLRRRRLTAWARANRQGVPGDSFLEGPVFDETGNLYVCDVEYGRVFRIDPRGEWEQVTRLDGEPNGMKFLGEDELLIADYRNGLVVLDVRTGVSRPFLERRNSERFKGVNDLVFDHAGNLYFTDQGQTGMHDPTGRVYRLRPDGRLETLLDNVPSPNGLVLSSDERVLFVAATRGNCVWRAPLMDDGGVSKVGVFFHTDGPAGPDGLAMDVADRLAVATPGRGLVWILSKRAEPVLVLRSPTGSMITNLAYGGPGRRTLYCTESETGSIVRIELDVSGRPPHVPGASPAA